MIFTLIKEGECFGVFPCATHRQFFLCISLHFATMFDILPGPTDDLREEGLKKQKKKIFTSKLKNKYIEKPLSRLLFCLFQFLFASVASPFLLLVGIKGVRSCDALAKCYDRPPIHKSLLQTFLPNLGKKKRNWSSG